MKSTIRIFCVIIFFGLFNSVNAQRDVNEDEIIGFACYYAGSPSKTVMKYFKKIAKKDYKWISNRLISDNNAERFMSVLSLEKLKDLNKYVLSVDESKLINKVKKSEDLVYVCGGCTYFESLSLNDLFDNEMSEYGKEYLGRIISQVSDD
ncbi:hypothetical protein [Winogradskyella ouciana]|uniref:hypothetical protein n=1 Tax=Winogradskyella ouciana TaxID=2608631 RepID=UPI003D2E5304